MSRVFTIPSGNGSVGETTLTVNLGISRALPDRETCIPDADIGMADTTLIPGMDDGPVTLHEVLAGRADIGDAVYEGREPMCPGLSGGSRPGCRVWNIERRRVSPCRQAS
jgi:MinD-like ATPase involved in chromosome partitioning or flagellar assembly